MAELIRIPWEKLELLGGHEMDAGLMHSLEELGRQRSQPDRLQPSAVNWTNSD